MRRLHRPELVQPAVVVLRRDPARAVGRAVCFFVFVSLRARVGRDESQGQRSSAGVRRCVRPAAGKGRERGGARRRRGEGRTDTRVMEDDCGSDAVSRSGIALAHTHTRGGRAAGSKGTYGSRRRPRCGRLRAWAGRSTVSFEPRRGRFVRLKQACASERGDCATSRRRGDGMSHVRPSQPLARQRVPTSASPHCTRQSFGVRMPTAHPRACRGSARQNWPPAHELAPVRQRRRDREGRGRKRTRLDALCAVADGGLEARERVLREGGRRLVPRGRRGQRGGFGVVASR